MVFAHPQISELWSVRVFDQSGPRVHGRTDDASPRVLAETRMTTMAGEGNAA